ncbi:hypothetical protein JCM10914A_21900 [Paenibacillus sp. JCM 10914]|uniref:stalk domain-containing protein n=1 Tax=Paenibacillus sp. JCM 10914 TaxID=1236974 RepID=UPI0003CCA8D9|nr:stalk domain-containing protein [Paenibacillus sp. JCM 10914]GAE09343.1 copper amine oxidase-like protein [Paenibacillus sp. JCM 10914]
MYKKLVLFISCLLLMIPVFIENSAADAAVKFDGTSQEQQEAGLAYLNQTRAGMGLREVTLDPALNKAAVSHARYADRHLDRGMKDNLSAQVQGKPYFTGITPKDRVQAAGYPDGDTVIQEIVLLEGSATHFEMENYAMGLLASPTHRVIITNPDTSAIGIAHVGKATVLIGAVDTRPNEPLSVSLYPYEGMSNVMMVDWITPMRPVEPLEADGMAITVHTNRQDVSGMKAALTRKAGSRTVEVPLTIDKMELEDGYILRAGVPLRGGVEYRVQVDFQAGGQSVRKEWNFTTIPMLYGMYIDDVPIQTLPHSFPIVGGHTMVPVRFVSETLGAKVTWSQSARSVTVKKDETLIRMVMGEREAFVNQRKVNLDSPPMLRDYTTYVPLRFISEAFGYDVHYRKQEQAIEIWTDAN